MNNETKILFITSSRIGDAVLSSGLLSYMASNEENAKITIACGPLATSLFEGSPNVERIIPVKKEPYNKHWIKLWRAVIGTKWDIVVDLRDSAVSRLIRAKRRYIFGKHIDKSQHKVLQNAAVMKLTDAPKPKLYYSIPQQEQAQELIPDGTPVVGIGPTANWAGKTWPVERFIEIIKWMSAPSGLMPDARIAVFAAPGEEEIAQKLLATIPKERALDVIAKTSPGAAAATLARCDFYIGNDSGLMHCAAAAGIPTIGVFGPSYPHLYAPWGKHTAYARTPETFDELIDFEGYDVKTVGCLMESLSTDMVKDTITNFWKKKKAA